MKKSFLTKKYTSIALLGAISVTTILQSNYLAYSQSSPSIYIAEADSSITLSNVQDNTIGIQLILPIISGDLSNVGFQVANSSNSGFITYTSDLLIIYLANSSDLRDDSNDISIGTLTNISGIEFASTGTVIASNFLFEETTYSSVNISLSSGDTGDGGTGDGGTDDDAGTDDDDSNSNSNSNSNNNSSSGGGSSSGGSSGGSSSLGSASTSTSTTTTTTTTTESVTEATTESLQGITTASSIKFDLKIEHDISEAQKDIHYQSIISNYSDVAVSYYNAPHWGRHSIAFCIEQGYFNDVYVALSDSTETDIQPLVFGTEENATRLEIVRVLANMLEDIGSSSYNNNFSDIDSNSAGTDAIAWALENKITTGTGDGSTFSPNDPVKRQEMAMFFSRFVSSLGLELPVLLEEVEFKDSSAIWDNQETVASIKQLQQAGIIQGHENGNFDPDGNITRSQFAKMLENFVLLLSEQDEE